MTQQLVILGYVVLGFLCMFAFAWVWVRICMAKADKVPGNGRVPLARPMPKIKPPPSRGPHRGYVYGQRLHAAGVLPKECRDFEISCPMDGCATVTFICNLTEDVAKALGVPSPKEGES